MPGFQSKRKTSSGKHVTRNGTVALDDAAALRAEALHTFHASWTAYKELAYPWTRSIRRLVRDRTSTEDWR